MGKERSCTRKSMLWTWDWKCKDPVDKNNDYFYYQGYYAGMSASRACPNWRYTFVPRAYKEERCTRFGAKDWQDTDWNGEKHDTCHVQISDDGPVHFRRRRLVQEQREVCVRIQRTR